MKLMAYSAEAAVRLRIGLLVTCLASKWHKLDPGRAAPMQLRLSGLEGAELDDCRDMVAVALGE